MATPWFRVWGDMINDPKWRTIARVSKQKIGDVIATYLHMLTLASNATERGRTDGWNDEDIATALDIDTEQVAAIRGAMQGRVLDGDYLTGWGRRQPIKEDGSAERGKAFRERQKQEKADNRTQPNADERNRTTEEIREEEIREETEQNIKTKAPAAPAYDPRPDLMLHGVDEQTAADWLALRKSKRAPVTRTALAAIATEAGKAGIPLGSALAICCQRAWTGFEAEWVQRDARSGPDAGSAKFNPTAYVNRNRIQQP